MWLNPKFKRCSSEYRNRSSHITEAIEPLNIFLLQLQKRCQNSQQRSTATWICGGTANPQLFLLPVWVTPTVPVLGLRGVNWDGEAGAPRDVWAAGSARKARGAVGPLSQAVSSSLSHFSSCWCFIPCNRSILHELWCAHSIQSLL